MALVEIKDFNALIDKIDYRIGNLLDFFYHQKYYKLYKLIKTNLINLINLLRQQNNSISQKLIWHENEINGDAIMFVIISKVSK